MILTDTSKFVLKVWATTLLAGSFSTFSILSTLTTFADNIKNPFDLIATSFMVTLTATLMTAPVALIFYTLAEVIVRYNWTTAVLKGLLVFVGGLLTFIFILLVFQQGESFLWTYGSTMIFFYCFFIVLTISILTFELKAKPKL
jgi:hypothetical protein